MGYLQTTTNVFADVVNAQVRALFDATKETILSEIDGRQLCTEYSPDVPSEQINGMSSPGYGQLTLEGQQYAANKLWRDYPVTLTIRKYTSQLAWSEEDVHWIAKMNSSKRENTFNDIASNGLLPLVGNINRDIARFFYLGAGTTFFTGGDAVALYSASHPIRATGATQSNILSGNYALTANALDLIITQMNRFQAPSGVQMRKCRRIALVVPTELETTAIQIKNSLYGPGNGNLGLQKASEEALRARGVTIDIVVLPEIPSAYSAQWYVVDLDRAARRFFLASAWMPRMNPETDFTHGTYSVNASTLFGPTALGWQWTAYSPGTGGTV